MPAEISRDPDVAAVLDPNEMITVYNLNQAKNSVYGQGLVDRSANDNRSLYTGFEASFSAQTAWRRDDVRKLDGGKERLGVLRV